LQRIYPEAILDDAFTSNKFASEYNTPIAEELKKLDGSLDIVPSGNQYRIKVKTKDGFNADIQMQGDNIRVYTGDNAGGDGLGGEFYAKVWDAAESLKKSYVPDSELSFANQKRTTANMLKYVSDRKGKGNKYITISPSQWGGKGLGGKPLTDSNAKKLADNFIDEIEMNYMDKPMSEISDIEAGQLAKERGSEEHVRIGSKTIELLRKYSKEGNFIAILSVLGISNGEN